jgi:hypothetical protein
MSMVVELPAVESPPALPPSAARRLLNLVRRPMLKVIKVFRLAAEFAYDLLTGPF